MDRPDWPLGGVGYLPLANRKLPTRATPNDNEAFIIKGDRDITPDDNQWPDEAALPGFRDTVESFARSLEALTRELLPLYATALGLNPSWFEPGFVHPFWRLRMTRYPAPSSTATPADAGLPADTDRFGINPHQRAPLRQRASDLRPLLDPVLRQRDPRLRNGMRADLLQRPDPPRYPPISYNQSQGVVQGE